MTARLKWPDGWPRTFAVDRKTAKFGETGARGHKEWLTISTAQDRLSLQLDLLHAIDPILSTNLERRIDGSIKGGQGEPADPGAALYFRLDGRDTVLACDRWNRVADNINAIAKHIEAIRGMDRWGVGSIKQAFTGYQALPSPEQWWQVLGIRETATPAEIDTAYRTLARAAHPDSGGTHAAMARLNAARDAGRAAQ